MKGYQKNERGDSMENPLVTYAILTMAIVLFIGLAMKLFGSRRFFLLPGACIGLLALIGIAISLSIEGSLTAFFYFLLFGSIFFGGALGTLLLVPVYFLKRT